jgi:VWFA-related protein
MRRESSRGMSPSRRSDLSKSAHPKGLGHPRRGVNRLSVGHMALVVFAGAFVFGASSLWPQQTQTPAPPPSGTARGTAAREEKKPETPQTIQVVTKVVNVPVSVLTRQGQPVIDLTKNDFQVYENGQPQTIRYFYRGTRPPLRIGVILDTSNSARTQLSFEKDAATEFVFNMLSGTNSKNQVFLQTFDATSSVLEDFTNDPQVLNEKVRGLKAGGGKALYDAIFYACKEKMLKLGQPENMRRVLVVVTDGLDFHSESSLDEAISMARRAETVIYTISNAAYGFDNPGDKVLSQMAQETGGAAFFPLEQNPGTDLATGYLSHGQIGDTSQNKGLGASTGKYSAERLIHLADSLEAISGELIEQYSLGYTPTNGTMDGTYRAIRVVAMRKNVLVRSKPGYFAMPEEVP